MLVGYARVSTQEQTLDLQKDALEKLGCTKIYSDVVSGAKAEREGLQEALEYVREGDTLVVWRLDRLGRSLKHLIETITRLNDESIPLLIYGPKCESWQEPGMPRNMR
jgi:DNA invertase Pin-like site-specific DNA recombinase